MTDNNYKTYQLRTLSLQIACDQYELTQLVLADIFNTRRTELCFIICYNQIIRAAIRNDNFDGLPKSIQNFYTQPRKK